MKHFIMLKILQNKKHSRAGLRMKRLSIKETKVELAQGALYIILGFLGINPTSSFSEHIFFSVNVLRTLS